MRITKLYSLFLEEHNVAIDSRKTVSKSIFFALKGSSFDGNMFVTEALDNGAKYAVIDNPYCAVEGKTVLVYNVLETLQEMARMHRVAMNIPVIGITGTNGKTTTKELVAAVLASTLNVLATEGNLNNHIGVPLSLLKINREHEIAVIEMGASKRWDIRELVNIAKPDCGIITNVGRAHLEGFGNFETLVKTKCELYKFLKRRTESVVFVNSSDKRLMAKSEGIRRMTYGSSAGDFVSGRVVENKLCMTFAWKRDGGREHTVQTNLFGKCNLDNALAAIAIGLHFGVAEDKISDAIAAYKPSNSRSQISKTEANTLIIDAYNANPDSMKAAIENFSEVDVTPKAIILGDMYELGKNSLACHTEIAEMAKKAGFERVILCGEMFCEAGQECIKFLTTEDLIKHLKAEPMKGYNILLKASRGMAFEKVVEFL